MKKIYLLILSFATLQTYAQVFTEGFDDVTDLYLNENWFSINNSDPNNTSIWFQDGGNFTAHSGAAGSCISAGWYCTDTAGTGDASVWLFTPPMMLHNGDTMSFYTISYNNADFPDRMEVRLNTTSTDTAVGSTSTSVGNYTGLLLTINPSLNVTDYPMVWTKYEVLVLGVPGGMGMGRIAFRYVVPNTGGMGVNGSVVGIDDFRYSHYMTGIEENDNIAFDVYPNPVSDQVYIRSNSVLQNVRVRDVQGKICQTAANIQATQYRLDVSGLERGMYLLEMETANGRAVERLVVR